MKKNIDLFQITSGDFLAGGGGVTEAMSAIEGLNCKFVLNHSPVAIKTNIFHHKKVAHYLADFYKQDEHVMPKVDFVWASIECTTHSKANGGADKKMGSYMMGFELVRYIKHIQPKMIGIENVPEFKKWSPVQIQCDTKNSTDEYSALAVDKKGSYKVKTIEGKEGEHFEQWKEMICKLGYKYGEVIINAADYGIPQRRKRFFCWFVQDDLDMDIVFPKPTHNKFGTNGLQKWVACGSFINLLKEGESIFGRKLNPNVPSHLRRQLCANTLKRLAGGVKRFYPELYMIMQYYGTGLNVQNIDTPLNTITTKDRHVLVKLEKLQFIQDYCHGDVYDTTDIPLSTQLTWQTKELMTLDFISDQNFSNSSKNSLLTEPTSTLTGQQRHQYVNSFISVQNNSGGNPQGNNHGIDEPSWSITTREKAQFISSYFNSSGHPETQNSDINTPLNTILTGANKQALVTAIANGEIDFDIKMRFLEPDELGRIMTFPEGYFTNPKLRLSKKSAIKLIGNAVPPQWAKMIIEPMVENLRNCLTFKINAA